MQSTPFHQHLEALYNTFKSLRQGAVADYIPELAKVDPDQFGIVIVTVDGHVYQVGDSKTEFSIQSISKAFTYGIALQDNDAEFVESKVDVEPSGEAFNSISLEPDTGRPKNPMINAGAIATSGLVGGATGTEKLDRILDIFAKYTGRPLTVDLEIYESEKNTGHRNRAISHLLRNYDILSGNPEEVLDVYFRQCSIKVTCRDLAVMGATLANDGVNPITGVRALDARHIPRVLGVMASCGMYDYSGNWIYRVGMPAKSGVGGGIVAVLPGQLGLAVFSPRLDEKGNSVRGLAVCEEVSKTFDLHMLHSTRTTTSSTIRRKYTANDIRSKISRPPGAQTVLEKHGHEIAGFDLAGDLNFVSAELIMHEIMSMTVIPKQVILNFRHVSSINQAAIQQLSDISLHLHAAGGELIFLELSRSFQLTNALKELLPDKNHWPLMSLRDLDHALEYCEEALLKRYNWQDSLLDSDANSGKQFILNDLTIDEIDFLSSLLHSGEFAADEIICKQGDPADKLYFIEEGQVSIWITISHNHKKRLNVIRDGFSFGEGALLGAEKRIAEIKADTKAVISWVETEKLLQDNSSLALSIQKKLYKNLAIQTFDKLEWSNREIISLMQ